jgi:hypothetical protein
LSAARGCIFDVFAATLHPQPEDAPCCGDRDPPNTATVWPVVPAPDDEECGSVGAVITGRGNYFVHKSHIT